MTTQAERARHRSVFYTMTDRTFEILEKYLFAPVSLVVIAGLSWCARGALKWAWVQTAGRFWGWIKSAASVPQLLQGLGNQQAALARGIDDLKNSFARQQITCEVLLTNGTYGMFVLDDEGRIVDVNRNYCRMLGAVPEDLQGHNWELFIPEGKRGEYIRQWELAVSREREYNVDLELIHAEGHPVYVNVRTHRLPAPDTGGESGFIGFVTLIPPEKAEMLFPAE